MDISFSVDDGDGLNPYLVSRLFLDKLETESNLKVIGKLGEGAFNLALLAEAKDSKKYALF